MRNWPITNEGINCRLGNDQQGIKPILSRFFFSLEHHQKTFVWTTEEIASLPSLVSCFQMRPKTHLMYIAASIYSRLPDSREAARFWHVLSSTPTRSHCLHEAHPLGRLSFPFGADKLWRKKITPVSLRSFNLCILKKGMLGRKRRGRHRLRRTKIQTPLRGVTFSFSPSPLLTPFFSSLLD